VYVNRREEFLTSEVGEREFSERGKGSWGKGGT
jgi:hypothetical protein